ncbi:hypothetical protein EJ03DRAFT_355299 [Teratosphaeria nubilosa]|uniref:Myb-like domain-containing protein n=1 Tax=Teratosphaeria nubilosa TaxID=161662 RepID=A0A6G1KY73_9PEZI|nr:hypothetical protein EJ03DRAFT_355299 [Teratosphaeria nubilosa]
MSNVLSEKQMQLLAAVCEVMKADIDWNRVAEIADMTTAKYARDSWTIVRNKLMGGKKPAAKKGKEGKEGKAMTKKRKAADAEEGGDDEEAPTAKKTASRKKRATPAAEEDCQVKKEEEEEEEEEEAEDEFS